MRPTSEQQAVIEHEQGRAVVFAVAGSGKTSTVVKRINRLIGECGCRPERILATTFSRAAKAQLDEKLKKEEHCARVNVATLHSLAFRIMMFQGEKLDAPRTITVDQDKLVGLFYNAKDRLTKGTGINRREADLDLYKIRDIGSEDFFNYLMQLKGDLLSTQWCFDLLPERAKRYFDVERLDNTAWLEALIDTYEDERRNHKYLGYEDIMVNATVQLGSNTELRENFSSQYEFIFVDEYQDVNKAQDKMLQFLDERAKNIMVIGDDDQTIYEWRGARPTFIQSKLTDPTWKQFKLSSNFRSSPGQVVLASQVISRNTKRTPKTMRPLRTFCGDLEIRRFNNETDQAKAITEIIKDIHIRDNNYSGVVILIRQYAETPLIEQLLIANGIPYDIPGSRPFYFRRETKYILDYLSLVALDENRRCGRLTPEESSEFLALFGRIYTRPKTYMRREDLKQIVKDLISSPGLTITSRLNEYNDAKESEEGRRSRGVDALSRFFARFIEISISDLKAADAIRYLDQEVEIRQWIIDSSVHEKIGKMRSQIIDALISYAFNDTVAKTLDDISTLKKFNADEIRGEDISKVQILTVFKSKGLEFPVVVIPNMNSSSSEVRANQFSVPTSQREPASMKEEERRIFYVAMTRAINDLHIFYTSPNPSEYLAEASYKIIVNDVVLLKAIFELQSNATSHLTPKEVAHLVIRAKRYQAGNAWAKAWSIASIPMELISEHFNRMVNIISLEASLPKEIADTALEYMQKIYSHSLVLRANDINHPLEVEQSDTTHGDADLIQNLPDDDGDFE